MKITKERLLILLELSSLDPKDFITNISIDDKHITVKGLTYDEVGHLFEITSIIPVKANDDTITLE
jgi:hypothetical protein